MSAPSRAIAQANRDPGTYRDHPLPSVVIAGESVEPNEDYRTQYPTWRTIRDCLSGERVIKQAGEKYLRCPSNITGNDYLSYRNRAYFYNATRRTHTGLLGSVMRKRPEVKLPKNLRMDLNSVTVDGMSYNEHISKIVSEVILVSRHGVLADIPREVPQGVAPVPFFSNYNAESVFYRREILFKGRKVVDRVILLETETTNGEYGHKSEQVYRILRLDPDPDRPERLRYSQQIYRPISPNRSAGEVLNIEISTQGRYLDYIPFVFFNTKNLLPAIDDPVLSDIIAINLSHYESTALLEHGRFYAGMPTYYIAGEGASGKGDFAEGLGTPQPMAVGPSNLWMLEKDDKCGLLEFTGHGLTFLENAVDSKQLQMQSLGGKLVGPQKGSAALGPEAYALMEMGDEATLLDIAQTVERGLTILLGYANDLANNLPSDDHLVELNKEFIRSDLTAREVRAIQTLYERKLIPLDILYYTLRQVGIIPMEYTLEDFKKLLKTPGQLYENPDYQQQEDIQQAGIEGQMELLDEQLTHDEKQAALDRRTQEKTAKDAARLAAARQNNGPAPGQPGQGQGQPAPRPRLSPRG